LYQGGVHVPMVVSGVGVDRSNDNEGALVCFADLFSTIVELTGTELGRYEDSYSFYHLLSSEGQGSRDCSYTEVGSITDNNSGWASRDEQYKYLQWVSGEEEFYDLISDPYEKNNLLPNLNAEQQLSYDKLSQVRSGLTKTQDLVENELSFSVFPIPAKNYINIHSVAELIDSDYFIFNQRGEQIATGIISGSENQVNIEHLPAGKYYLQIGNGQRSFLKF